MPLITTVWAPLPARPRIWMYHAVGQTILAANALRADSRVAADKVGVTGISWGGVISSITIGWDNRFAFAVPGLRLRVP